MKTTTWLNHSLVLVIGLLVGACAQNSPLTSSKVKYQTTSSNALKNYAASVSKGFKGFTSSTAKRGIYTDGSFEPSRPYNGFLMRADIRQEVEECKQVLEGLPENCANLDYMMGTLSRCLNRIITHRNPVMTYANRHLDAQGQNHWSYLLNWRRPAPIENFSQNDFNILNQFALRGYSEQDWQ